MTEATKILIDGKFQLCYLVDLPFEKWAAIKSFTHYFLSNYGRIRYQKVKHVGYPTELEIVREYDIKLSPKVPITVSMIHDTGEQMTINVAKLVAFNFLDMTGLLDKMVRIEFKDGNSANCRASNIRITEEIDEKALTRRRRIPLWMEKVIAVDGGKWYAENLYI